MDIIKGYTDAISNNGNNGFQQGESSQVSIRGNNNDVNVNQAENVQSGSDTSWASGAICLMCEAQGFLV